MAHFRRLYGIVLIGQVSLIILNHVFYEKKTCGLDLAAGIDRSKIIGNKLKIWLKFESIFFLQFCVQKITPDSTMSTTQRSSQAVSVSQHNRA